jgi:hypothetical protein
MVSSWVLSFDQFDRDITKIASNHIGHWQYFKANRIIAALFFEPAIVVDALLFLPLSILLLLTRVLSRDAAIGILLINCWSGKSFGRQRQAQTVHTAALGFFVPCTLGVNLAPFPLGISGALNLLVDYRVRFVDCQVRFSAYRVRFVDYWVRSVDGCWFNNFTAVIGIPT